MIRLCNSLILARKVLNAVLKDKRNKSSDGWVDAFQNCREQGYTLVITRNQDAECLTISIAECRGSDEIVVYNSKESGEGFQNKFSEIFWNSDKYFNCNAISDAGDYIFSLIKTFQEEEKVTKEVGLDA